MSKQFTSAFFKGNRRELLKNVESKLIVVTANNELQRSGDTSFPFRQDSNFWYLTGIDEPNFILVISERTEYLIKPNRHWVKDIFDGAISDKELTKKSGITQILDNRAGWKKLTKQLDASKIVSTLFPMQDRHFNITANPARRQLINKMRRRVPALHADDIRLVMAKMRMVKQEPELAAIQKAIDITCDSLNDVFKAGWSKHYKYEYELEADINASFRKKGADEVAFPTIIAVGKEACQIHPTKNDKALKRGELLLFDLGAELGNYGADISRTLSINGKLTARQKEVFDGVKEVYDYAQTQLKPGVLIREYEQEIERYMGEVLARLGLIKKQDRKHIRKYFPHATSHMLGLDTHDAADYSEPLAENMVLTIEPGIYIPAEGIGVRIEDDFLVTKDGIKNLSAKLPPIIS